MSRVVLVTGSNTGIGYELVRLVAEKGHIVYIGARKEAAGKEAVEKLVGAGLKNIKFVRIDVTDLATVLAAKEIIEQQEGRLDVLVNNAGISRMGEDQNATTIDISVIRDTMETNFFGLIQTTQTFIPLLRKSTIGGVILNVTTDMASNTVQARPDAQLHVTAYNTSKAAANSYAIALSHELRKEGIKVNAVTPGYTSTKLNHFGAGGKSIAAGAGILLPWALLERDGPTGLFIDEHGKEYPW